MRYLAQRPGGAFIHTNLRLQDARPAWALSGAGGLDAFVAPDLGDSVASDGLPLFEEWGTIIHLEMDGFIRGSWIVDEVKDAGARRSIGARGIAGYPEGTIARVEWERVQIDPAQVVRDFWTHMQAYQDAKLGVTVTGSTTQRIGAGSTAAVRNAEAAQKTAKAAAEAATKERQAKAKQRAAKAKELAKARKKPKAADSVINALKKQLDDLKAEEASLKATETARKATLKTRNETLKNAKEREREDGGAYIISELDATDIGREIDDLATEAPFDYTVHSSWNSSKTNVTHEYRIHYPSAGRRRTDLTFVMGTNVMNVPEREGFDTDYASEVIGIGAGEGRGAIRTSAGVRSHRLRRTRALEAKDVKKRAKLASLVSADLAAAQRTTGFTRILVHPHSFAPIGSWELGDEIFVRARIPHAGQVERWQRIVGWELTPQGNAELELTNV